MVSININDIRIHKKVPTDVFMIELVISKRVNKPFFLSDFFTIAIVLHSLYHSTCEFKVFLYFKSLVSCRFYRFIYFYSQKGITNLILFFFFASVNLYCSILKADIKYISLNWRLYDNVVSFFFFFCTQSFIFGDKIHCVIVT